MIFIKNLSIIFRFRTKEKCTALWVGNVNSHVVTEKKLSQLFGKYGKLVSVRLLPEKYCAFINYHVAEDAANALEELQVCFRLNFLYLLACF